MVKGLGLSCVVGSYPHQKPSGLTYLYYVTDIFGTGKGRSYFRPTDRSKTDSELTWNSFPLGIGAAVVSVGDTKQ